MIAIINVSNAYKQAVYAPSRRTAAKVRFEILDNEAYDDCTSTVTGEAVISRREQLTNKKRIMSHKYATFERDYLKLDGSFYIPPSPEETLESELSWWSAGICNAAGEFNPYQVVELSFAEEHNSMGLTITFDPVAKEWASDFDIDVYQVDDTLIHHETVIGNSKATYVMIQGLDNYRKIKITIKKWAKPYRRARMTEVDFGVVKEYEGDKLIKVSLLEEMNVVGDTIPANELKFTIDNSSREFNILNPEGFYRFLKERQEIEAAIGVEIATDTFEYVDFKKYYLTDWQSDEGALTTTFTARNIFELLDQKEYTGTGTTNLYDLAEDIFRQAAVSDYKIDTALKDIHTLGFVKPLTFRKALQYIGIAGKAAVYQDRQGVLRIEQFRTLDEASTYLVYCGGSDMYCGMAYVAVDKGYDMKNITFDNVYKPPQIKLNKLLYTLTMVVYSAEAKQEIDFVNPYTKEGITLKCDNPLINTPEHAAELAEWIMEEHNLRAMYTINWRQNPCLECGDIVLVEDSFNAKKQSRITKMEFDYQGYLSGQTESKGGV